MQYDRLGPDQERCPYFGGKVSIRFNIKMVDRLGPSMAVRITEVSLFRR